MFNYFRKKRLDFFPSCSYQSPFLPIYGNNVTMVNGQSNFKPIYWLPLSITGASGKTERLAAIFYVVIF